MPGATGSSGNGKWVVSSGPVCLWIGDGACWRRNQNIPLRVDETRSDGIAPTASQTTDRSPSPALQGCFSLRKRHLDRLLHFYSLDLRWQKTPQGWTKPHDRNHRHGQRQLLSRYHRGQYLGRVLTSNSRDAPFSSSNAVFVLRNEPALQDRVHHERIKPDPVVFEIAFT